MMSNPNGNNEDLVDAVRLLEDADNWRQKYVVYADESEKLKQRKQAIAQWLPLSADWTKIDERVRSLAAEAGVDVVALRQLDRHVGSRVGVVECECQLKGTFQAICVLTQQLSDLNAKGAAARQASRVRDQEWTYPVWCHQIRLQRLPVIVDNQIQCAATLTIRVPYAAKGSAAANILMQESNDA
jgi:hypothetical protein